MTRVTGKFANVGELKNVGVFAYFTHGKFNENTAIPNFMYNQLVKNNWMREHGLIVRSSSGRTITTDKISLCLCPYVNEVENGYLFSE